MYESEAIVVLTILFIYMFFPLVKRVFKRLKERYDQARLEALKRKLAAMQAEESKLKVAPLSACKPCKLRKVKQAIPTKSNKWQDNLDAAGMVQAVVLSEVLGTPRAYQPFFSRKNR